MKLSFEELDRWYVDYADYAVAHNYDIRDSGTFQSVNNDEIDEAFVVKEITDSMSKIKVEEGFCAKCREIFDSWPDCETFRRSECVSSNYYDNTYVVSKPYQENIYVLEASKRRGCQFCALIVQSLLDKNVLELFRKISRRLSMLYKPIDLSMYIKGWSLHSRSSRDVQVSLPGKSRPKSTGFNVWEVEASPAEIDGQALYLFMWNYSDILQRSRKADTTQSMLPMIWLWSNTG